MRKHGKGLKYLVSGFVGVLILLVAFPALATEVGRQGINWKGYIYRIINFIILVFLLIKFLKKPLTEFLERRHNQVKEELRKAQELSAAAESAYREAQQRLANMDREVHAIREQMLRDVEQEKNRLLEEAKKKATIMRTQAEQELREEIEQMKKKIREDISLKALTLAEDLVKRSITEEDQKRLVDLYVQQVGGKN